MYHPIGLLQQSTRKLQLTGSAVTGITSPVADHGAVRLNAQLDHNSSWLEVDVVATLSTWDFLLINTRTFFVVASHGSGALELLSEISLKKALQGLDMSMSHVSTALIRSHLLSVQEHSL